MQLSDNLSNNRIVSENVFRSREPVDIVAAGKRLHIYGVLGHTGVTGNEVADEIAKGAIRLTTEPVPKTLESLKTIHNEISERADRWIRARGNAIRLFRIGKIMCKSPE